MELNGKVAVVTGGASGLGRATVEMLVSKGAKVAIFDLNEELGQKVSSEHNGQVDFYQVNIVDEESVASAINAIIDQWGAIHICCNYAGMGPPCKTFGRKGPHPLDHFNNIIQVNLVGTFNVLRLCAEQMSKNEPVNEDGGRGVIINTASVAAYDGQMGQAAYSASKGGIISMTLPIARDLAGIGIRVNTIVPGLIHTPLFDSIDEAVIESLNQQVLFPKRLGEPTEIAKLAKFIIENDYVNAECVRLDGGIRMQAK